MQNCNTGSQLDKIIDKDKKLIEIRYQIKWNLYVILHPECIAVCLGMGTWCSWTFCESNQLHAAYSRGK